MKKIMVMVAMGMVAAASQATLLFYDDFSSAAGTLLGTTPDTGTAWNYKTNSPAGDAYKVIATGLTAPSGFKTASGGSATKTADGNDSYSTYTGAPAATAGNSIYYSFLFSSTQAVTAASTGGRITAISAAYDSDYAAIRYDKVLNDSFYKLSLVTRGLATGVGCVQLTNQLALGSTHLIVVSYTYVTGNTNDIVRVWLDPDSATFNAGTAPAATLTVNGSTYDLTKAFDSLRLGGQSGTPNTVMIDELRVGTTWADVAPAFSAPIPAPSITSALSATGTISQTFSYQITADNSPASFDATGLPAGLIVNTNSGTITGTPSVAGSNDVIISASNAGGRDGKTLVVIIRAASADIDGDGDGIPDSWETQYFGGPTNANPSAMAANGVNTVYETYIAGLNPTNPAAYFRFSIQQTASQRLFQWSAVSGRVYSVYWTTNLISGFQSLETNIVWPQNSWTGQVSGSQADFYKISVRLSASQTQTIAFPNPGDQATNTVVLTATASSGLPVTYAVVSGPASLSGSNVTFTGTGSVTLSANQAGNESWNPAPQTNVTFTVSKATATVTLSGLSQTYDGLEHSVTVTTVPAGLTVGITYNGGSTLPVAVGGYTVTATVNDPICQGSTSGTLTIILSNQNVQIATMETREVWTNGYVRLPSIETRVGRQTTSCFSSGVMMFELPDLKGATIVSANLKFRVNSVGYMNSNNNCNLNIEAIRSGAMGSAITSNDYRTIGQPQAGEFSIQDDVARWNDGSLPRDYETSGAAADTLGGWLADQYDSAGIGGVVFLRLAADRDPTNNYYYSIPSDSISLTITTAGDIAPLRGSGNTVSARIGVNEFSWTFDRNVDWGHFIDGMPWVVMPQSGSLNLTAASPARVNGTNVYKHVSISVSTAVVADINITVKNPPFDHTFSTNTLSYSDNTSGVFGWDSREAEVAASPTYNALLGWDGTTYLPLAAGDCITTPKSTIANPMPSRSATLDALAVLTVLSNVPPADAFRPAVIRSGTDRTNPEIIRYSDLIDLSPYLISNPVGVTTDLRGTNVSAIASEYTYNKMRACLPGPGFLNTGYSSSQGAAARFNTYAYPVTSDGDTYGGTIGLYMGYLGVGSLAGWLTEDERKLCRIRYIQRAIDAYGPIKAGMCVEEGAGMLPGYTTLITAAGIMLNHSGMKSINQGVNGVKPWWIFADYATTWHTDGISTNDLAAGETMNDRLIPICSLSTNRSNLNKTNAQPVAAATLTTMTIKTNFWWDGSRPIDNIINLKFRIVSGAGAGPTIYVITNTITAGVTDNEKFRTTETAAATLYVGGGTFGYYYGGKVGIKPAFQNGLPDANSVLAFSITTSDTDNPASDDACWYWAVDGVVPITTGTSYLMRTRSVSASPLMEYSSIHTGANIGSLITLYALGQQDIYKAGLDKYMINAGERPGYGELLFKGSYLAALGSGTAGNFLGALWKQEVLNTVGAAFQYTDGTGGALDVPHVHAKMWFEP